MADFPTARLPEEPVISARMNLNVTMQQASADAKVTGGVTRTPVIPLTTTFPATP